MHNGGPAQSINLAEVRWVRSSDKAVRRLFIGREVKPHGVGGWKRSFLRSGRERRQKNENLRSMISVGNCLAR